MLYSFMLNIICLIRIDVFVYDLKTKKETPFVDLSTIPSPQFIAVDPVSEDVYIGNRNSGALDDVYIYSKEGQFKKKIETGNYTTNIRFLAE